MFEKTQMLVEYPENRAHDGILYLCVQYDQQKPDDDHY
jgi:hypothetical protein